MKCGIYLREGTRNDENNFKASLCTHSSTAPHSHAHIRHARHTFHLDISYVSCRWLLILCLCDAFPFTASFLPPHFPACIPFARWISLHQSPLFVIVALMCNFLCSYVRAFHHFAFLLRSILLLCEFLCVVCYAHLLKPFILACLPVTWRFFPFFLHMVQPAMRWGISTRIIMSQWKLNARRGKMRKFTHPSVLFSLSLSLLQICLCICCLTDKIAKMHFIPMWCSKNFLSIHRWWR